MIITSMRLIHYYNKEFNRIYLITKLIFRITERYKHILFGLIDK
jgi:hypothetical protein